MTSRKRSVRIGSGSACPGERLEPALELVERGEIEYIVFDSLSETEMLAFEKDRLRNPDAGYDVYTTRRLRTLLPACQRNGVKIIGNMGGANPLGALRLALKIARENEIRGMRIAAVLGDNVLEVVRCLDLVVTETGGKVADFGDRLVAAHAYVPADSVVEALDAGADLVITGRMGDASLYLAPMRHALGWRDNDWDMLARGMVVGHLFECGGQVSGGYFADPPYKVVPDLYRLGFPLAEVRADGEVTITKVPGTGGLINRATCAEQMLYEVGDPANYVHADVVIDFTDIDFVEVGPDRVALDGTIRGKPRPERLKVNLGAREGYRAEGMVFYAGPGAYDRAKLAAETMRLRLERVTRLQAEALRFDLVGLNAIYGPQEEQATCLPWEVGVRVAGRTATREEAWKIMHELETIDNNGPAAIARGLRREDLVEILGYYSTLIPRVEVSTRVVLEEV